MMRQMGSSHTLFRFHPPHTLSAPDHHTRSRIIRTTPSSSASTADLSPSRGWCPIANAAPLCVSRTQSRPQTTECISASTFKVRRSPPVDESHTLQVPSWPPEASFLPSYGHRVNCTRVPNQPVPHFTRLRIYQLNVT